MTQSMIARLRLPSPPRLNCWGARDLGPMLKKNAAQTETDRRVAEENIQAITDAGLFRIAVPKRYGGYEVPIRTFVQISSELGRACGSTAWATTLINVCAWLTGLYPQQAQDEVSPATPMHGSPGFSPQPRRRRRPAAGRSSRAGGASRPAACTPAG